MKGDWTLTFQLTQPNGVVNKERVLYTGPQEVAEGLLAGLEATVDQAAEHVRKELAAATQRVIDAAGKVPHGEPSVAPPPESKGDLKL